MTPHPRGILLQAFEWYSSPGHYQRLQSQLAYLKELDIDNVWLPPGCKAGSPHSNGYDAYDLYDLGEFEQKGSRATKWGSKEKLLDLANAAKAVNIGIVWDAELGHKASADRTEVCRGVKVDPEDRRIEIAKPKDIEAWLCFDYPGREHIPRLKHTAEHFNGTDYDHRTGEKAIYKLRDWAKDVDAELGNYDYLLCANLDLSHPEVREDTVHWARWIVKELRLSGFRFDAVKHMSRGFVKMLINSLDPERLLIGEYATPNAEVLTAYIESMQHRMHLFDFALHANFVRFSRAARPDLRKMLDGALVKLKPETTVTFVNNHDTQDRGREEEFNVAQWFLPMAYAWILLSTYGGYPCVFYGDLFGVNGPDKPRGPACPGLPLLMRARTTLAHGPQRARLDDPTCVGFTREGLKTEHDASGVAAIMCTGMRPQQKRMFVGRHHASEIWAHVLGTDESVVQIDEDGCGLFTAPTRGLGVYAEQTMALCLRRGQP